MDNQTNSRRSGSYNSHDKRGISVRSISDGKKHHHSPRHSIRIFRSRSSHVKKPKKIGVDELQGKRNKIKPPTFYGEHKKD